MIQNVYAADGVGAQGSSLSMLMFMALFFLVFYFIALRPKQKQQAEHNKLVDSLSKGDEVITYSGIMGKVERIKDQYIVLSIADNVEIKIQKNHVQNMLPKGTLKAI